MLNKDVFFTNMENLLKAFPNWKLDVEDKETVRFWYGVFSNFKEDRFAYMIDSYIMSENFNPTIGGLRKHDNLPQKSATQIKHEKMLRENQIHD